MPARADRRKVQTGVGRAAGRRDRGGGVLQALARHQLARQRAAVAEDAISPSRRRHAPRRDGLGVGRGQHRRPGCREPERPDTIAIVLAVNCPGQAPSVGAQARSISARSGLRHLPREDRADALVRVDRADLAPVPFAGEHRAPVHEDARHVEPHHRHHHRGQRLSQPASAHQRVVAVAVTTIPPSRRSTRARRGLSGMPRLIATPSETENWWSSRTACRRRRRPPPRCRLADAGTWRGCVVAVRVITATNGPRERRIVGAPSHGGTRDAASAVEPVDRDARAAAVVVRGADGVRVDQTTSPL